jgi:hypothetical protein
MAFAPGMRRLEINYTALALTASHKIGFRYRLEGVDPDWVDGWNATIRLVHESRSGRLSFPG